MSQIETLVDRYCDGWSASTPEQREQLIRSALTDEASYCDPRADSLNISNLLEHISNVHRSRPGAMIRRTSNVDVHHGLARFHWQVVMPDGTKLPEGIDFIELSPDSARIARVVGFFGPLRGEPEK